MINGKIVQEWPMDPVGLRNNKTDKEKRLARKVITTWYLTFLKDMVITSN